ncbi:hypothetical protein ABTK43_19735, partial [Acinetobacter baumannii]
RLADFRLPKAARQVRWHAWGTGIAAAASLLIGLMLGKGLTNDDQAPVASRGGALIANGSLAQALDTQLAATQGANSAVRMI